MGFSSPKVGSTWGETLQSHPDPNDTALTLLLGGETTKSQMLGAMTVYRK